MYHKRRFSLHVYAFYMHKDDKYLQAGKSATQTLKFKLMQRSYNYFLKGYLTRCFF